MIADNKTYSVYKHLNKINNKIYIGITCQKPNKRWQNGRAYKHNKFFYDDIIRYGWKFGFEHKVLIHGLTLEQAWAWERKLIRIFDLTNCKNGYNLDKGGRSGNRLTEETKNKISEIKKEKYLHGEITAWNKGQKCPQLSGKNNGFYGRKHSAESLKKMSEKHKGQKLTEETKLKIKKAHTGKHVGELNNMYNKTGNEHPKSKKIICLENKVIYESINIAQKILKTRHISDCCRFKRNKTKNLHFLFYDDYKNMSSDEINNILNK